MIKPKFTFFQMEIKCLSLHASEANQTSLSISPKAFYAIDMAMLIGKFILAMLDSIMLLVTKVYQTVIPSPAIRMNNAFWVNAATNNALQGGSGAVWDNLCIDFSLPFEETKNYCFPSGSTSSESSDSASTKITFIDFNLA